MSVLLQTIPMNGDNGLDIVVLSRDATVDDLLQALQAPADDEAVFKPLHRNRYGKCAGCVYNCCKSNDIPLDLLAAKAIASHLNLSFTRFAQSFLKLDKDVHFPEFRKRPCPFLKENLCTIYEFRALICRLYICTPMSDRLEKLRSAVLLMGEAALRQSLVDLGLGPKTWTETSLLKTLQRERRTGVLDDTSYIAELSSLDMLIHTNPYLDGYTHETVKLKDCCTKELWDQLTNTAT